MTKKRQNNAGTVYPDRQRGGFRATLPHCPAGFKNGPPEYKAKPLAI